MIEANDPKFPRRIYFMENKLIVIRSYRSRYDSTILSLFLLLGPMNIILIMNFDFFTGMLLAGTLSSFFALLVFGILNMLKTSYAETLNGLSPDEMLKMDKKNFMVNYSKISHIWVVFDPNRIGKRNAELHINGKKKRYKYIIPAKYVERTIMLVERVNRRALKKRKELKLKS